MLALERAGHRPMLQWFEHHYELMPWRLKKICAPQGTDIVHASSWQAFAFKRRAIPLVVTEHHYVLDPAFRSYKSRAQHLYHRWLIEGCMRRSFASADAITTDSEFTAQVLSRCAGVNVARVIPLWADYERFSPATNSSDSNGDKSFRLLYVGNASRRKGADVIPELASRLGSDFEIRCTGGLRDAAGVGGRANVTILGRRSEDELVEEYRRCDAVLVPSRYEGFGYAALEAMACAKPVVGFRCGAVDEVVSNGETALLCDVDDVDTLAAYCRRLASERHFAMAVGLNGRARAISKFSEVRAVDAYVELYRSIATERK